MATVVSLPNESLCNWTGVLSDLDCCEEINVDFLEGMSENKTARFLNWQSRATSSTTVNTTSNNSPSATDSSSDRSTEEKQCWRIRQFLHSLQRSFHSHGHVTPEQLKQLPLTLFSSVLDRNKDVECASVCHGYFTAPDIASSQAASETDLSNAASEDNLDRFLPHQLNFWRLNRTPRRHYNSESDIPNNLINPHSIEPIVKRPVLNLSIHCNESRRLAQNDEYTFCSERRPAAPSTEQSTPPINEKDPSNNDSAEKCNDTVASSSHRSVLTTDNSYELDSPITGNVDISEDHAVEDSVTPSTQMRSALKGSSESLSGSAISTTKLSKSVSFADEVGEELTEVFMIESDESKIPDYEADFNGYMWTGTRRPRLSSTPFSKGITRSRLKKRSMTFPEDQTAIVPQSSQNSVGSHNTNNAIFTRSLWVLKFSQPAAKYYEFRQKVENGSISLENITLTQPEDSSTTQLPHLAGTIKVKNLSFEKQVWIRLTVDNWQSFTDYVALYNPQLSSGLIHSANRFDTFTFQINVVPQLEHPGTWDRLEFAIRYLVGHDGTGGQFWDSNGGLNYVIERKVVQSSWPLTPGEVNRYGTPASRVNMPLVGECGSNHAIACADSTLSPYTSDYRPNFEGMTQFTNYRAWTHFSEETTYY